MEARMIALLLAAALTVTPGAEPAARETPNAYVLPAHCRDIQRRVKDHQRDVFRRLGQEPRANLEYAVLRSIAGCPVPAPMGYHPPAPPTEKPAK
jgi:hypothetical protein